MAKLPVKRMRGFEVPDHGAEMFSLEAVNWGTAATLGAEGFRVPRSARNEANHSGLESAGEGASTPSPFHG
jgi:hypothetical protein